MSREQHQGDVSSAAVRLGVLGSASGQGSPGRLSLLLQGSSAGRGGSGSGGGSSSPSASGPPSLTEGGGRGGGGRGSPTAGSRWFSEAPTASDGGVEVAGPDASPLSPLCLAKEGERRAGASPSLPSLRSVRQSPECGMRDGVLGSRSGEGSTAADVFLPVIASWPSSPTLVQHPTHGQLTGAEIDSWAPRVAAMEESCFFEATAFRSESPSGALIVGSLQQLHTTATAGGPASSSQEYLPSAETSQQPPYSHTISDVARSHSFLPRIPQQLQQQQLLPAEERPFSEAVRSATAGAVSASWPVQQAMKAQVCADCDVVCTACDVYCIVLLH